MKAVTYPTQRGANGRTSGRMVCAKEHGRTNRRPPSTSCERAFDAAHKGASKVRTVCGSAASTGLCGGQRVTAVPTATVLR